MKKFWNIHPLLSPGRRGGPSRLALPFLFSGDRGRTSMKRSSVSCRGRPVRGPRFPSGETFQLFTPGFRESLSQPLKAKKG
ncbi:MAG: hypothetical protein M0C28_21225 [Candidatus Moduliflexus flocculans]|nr:hypothetical protein [Candidatus Moduliflexus flocculans]